MYYVNLVSLLYIITEVFLENGSRENIVVNDMIDCY